MFCSCNCNFLFFHEEKYWKMDILQFHMLFNFFEITLSSSNTEDLCRVVINSAVVENRGWSSPHKQKCKIIQILKSDCLYFLTNECIMWKKRMQQLSSNISCLSLSYQLTLFNMVIFPPLLCFSRGWFSKVEKMPVLLYVWSCLWISYCSYCKTSKGRQFQGMADYINMKLLYCLIRVYFSPFWNEIEWSWNESWKLNIEISSLMRVEYCFICLKCFFDLLLYLEGKARLGLLNIVTSWNGDSENLPVVFLSSKVIRNVSYVETCEPYHSQDVFWK